MTDATSTGASAPATGQTPAGTPQSGAISGAPAMLCAQMYAGLVANLNLTQQNAVAYQQALNEVGITITGACVNALSRSARHPAPPKP